MNLLFTTPWDEFKRRHPVSAENIASILLQALVTLVVVVCAIYALKYKPFQSFSLTPSNPAVQTARHKITLTGAAFPVRISLLASSNRNW